MHHQLLENGTLQIEYENYQPWPQFQPLGAKQIGGLWKAHCLKEALSRDNLACAAWRAHIPVEILRSLQCYNECQAELLEMAQAMPKHYIQIADWNPAFTLIAATYWVFRYGGRVPSIEERITIWENLDPDQLLNFTRFPDSKSFLKALGRIPPEEAYLHRVQSLRDLWAIPEKRRLLQHLPRITGSNLWLLSCYPPILDPAIHQLAANEPKHEEYSIQEVISDLANRREINGLHHWPYRNRIHTWEQLLLAYNRFLCKINNVQEVFPRPPIDGARHSDLHIVPIKSRTALRQESADMSNCIESFCTDISCLKLYAYKLLHPERATVLIKRQIWGGWLIQEAMIQANEREVKPRTMRRLVQWVRARRN